jgi:hypothetical protein
VVLALVQQQCAEGSGGRENACCGGHSGDAGSGGAQAVVAHLN